MNQHVKISAHSGNTNIFALRRNYPGNLSKFNCLLLRLYRHLLVIFDCVCNSITSVQIVTRVEFGIA